MPLAVVFVLIAALWRVVFTDAHGFTPVLASLLFFGSRAERKWLWAPALLLATTDVYLNYAHYGYKLTPDFLVTWAWYAAIVWLGSVLKEKQGWLRIAGVTLAGSISFFVLSNFMVWVVWNMYPRTLEGLLNCYAAGIPFYRNQFAGDLIFTAFAFALPSLLTSSEAQEHRVSG